MSIGQGFSSRSGSFSMSPVAFVSTHVATITGCNTLPIPFNITFGNYFISKPAYFGGISTLDASGSLVILTIDSNITLEATPNNLFTKATGFLNVTVENTCIATFEATLCLIFISNNGTY
jgi:hypothetical protein